MEALLSTNWKKNMLLHFKVFTVVLRLYEGFMKWEGKLRYHILLDATDKKQKHDELQSRQPVRLDASVRLLAQPSAE
jgi:hypothetical protein